MHSLPAVASSLAERQCPAHDDRSRQAALPRWQSPPLRTWNPLSRDTTALQASCYAAIDRHGQLNPTDALRHNTFCSVDMLRQAHDEMHAYVMDPAFPCVGARSAFNRGRYRMGLYERLGAPSAVAGMCSDLYEFSHEFPSPGQDPVTFVAVFDEGVASEGEFERRLWQHLQAAHAFDRRHFAWDGEVSSDPSQAEFSFSIGGRAYFVVGLHPGSARLARRAPRPMLVFNFHEQFEALRGSGKYGSMQKVVRQRDIALQGDINPVLSRFGEASEARQYSGVNRGEAWQCPFRALKDAA
jgi:FPC/CPF motif-containing protein YcgG